MTSTQQEVKPSTSTQQPNEIIPEQYMFVDELDGDQVDEETVMDTIQFEGNDDVNILNSLTTPQRDHEKPKRRRTRESCVEEVTALQLQQMKEVQELKKMTIKAEYAAAKAKEA